MRLRIISAKADSPPLLTIKAETVADVTLLCELNRDFNCDWVQHIDASEPKRLDSEPFIVSLAIPLTERIDEDYDEDTV